MTTKKCTKKPNISVKLLFCLLNVLIFRHSLRRRCRQILRSLYYIWELSGVLLELKKEIVTYEYNDYSEDDFLIQIFRLFLLIHLGPVVRVFKHLFFTRISLLLLRRLSFGSLWVYVICQIMTQGRLQLTSWNLTSEKYTDERFNWPEKLGVFAVSIATWTIEYNTKISLLLSLHKIRSLDFPINLHTAYYSYSLAFETLKFLLFKLR